jgi:hypothetical protein
MIDDATMAALRAIAAAGRVSKIAGVWRLAGSNEAVDRNVIGRLFRAGLLDGKCRAGGATVSVTGRRLLAPAKMPPVCTVVAFRDTGYRCRIGPPQDRPRVWDGDPTRPTLYSRAPLARAGSPLWAAVPDFGHHQHGAVLQPVGERAGPVLFYFHPGPTLPLDPFTERQRAILVAAKKADAAWEQEQDAKVAREDAEALAKMLAVFA